MDFDSLIQDRKATVIVGGQFGSEAKGLAAAIVHQLAGTRHRKWCTTNAGAQAGHTTVMKDGSKFVCYHLPTLGVLDMWSRIYINAGSIIDPVLLEKEIRSVSAVTGEDTERLRDRIFVDPFATVISEEHRNVEAGSMGKIGSTMKGVGAALTNKIQRNIDAVAGNSTQMTTAVMRVHLSQALAEGDAVTIEIPQGTGLSINSSGMFPFTTSRECWVGQGLTDAGLHPAHLGPVVMVSRTLPIRVGNVWKNDELVGTSGPFFDGSHELEWERDLPSQTPERTTVTNRVRRIATWSRRQYLNALALNRPSVSLLTFCNYLSWQNLVALDALMRADEEKMQMKPFHLYSWGPKAHQTSPNMEACAVHCPPHDDAQDRIRTAMESAS